MLAAYFVSCVMNAVGAMNCSVSHTEMDSVAKTLTDCTRAAAVLQNDAVQSVLIADLSLIAVRKESGCGTPGEAEAVAVREYNKLRAQGIEVELFVF
jgi:hypothetical protein